MMGAMMQNYNSEVAAEVRAAIARRQVTHADLAETLGVSTSTLSRKLAGKTPFTASDLILLSGVLYVQPGDLLPQFIDGPVAV